MYAGLEKTKLPYSAPHETTPTGPSAPPPRLTQTLDRVIAGLMFAILLTLAWPVAQALLPRPQSARIVQMLPIHEQDPPVPGSALGDAVKHA